MRELTNVTITTHSLSMAASAHIKGLRGSEAHSSIVRLPLIYSTTHTDLWTSGWDNVKGTDWLYGKSWGSQFYFLF